MTNRKIILGTRGSELALTQARMVRTGLEQSNPGLEVDFQIIVTTGDRRTDIPLADVGKVTGVVDKGVFMKEIEQALESGEIDMAVHSLKDMPSVLEPAFELAAVLPRAAVEDVLVSKSPELSRNMRIATGSVRRRRMAGYAWGEEIVFSDLRGNVPTRLSKLAANPDLDGIVLAKAGLDRLGLFGPRVCIDGVNLYMHVLPVSQFVPAAGQGIVGIEIRSNDAFARELALSINHEPDFLCARAEREFLKELGANCSTPVGVHASLGGAGNVMALHVMLYREGREKPDILSGSGDPSKPEQLAGLLLTQLDRY